jgi:hypothetical protein
MPAVASFVTRRARRRWSQRSARVVRVAGRAFGRAAPSFGRHAPAGGSSALPSLLRAPDAATSPARAA